MTHPPPGIAVIGAGRMGQGLALALGSVGARVALLGRAPHPVAKGLELLPSAAWGDAIAGAGTGFLAVPDDVIEAVAGAVAATGAVRPGTTIFHVSGRLGADALAPLRPTGAALGSFHPLQTIVNPLDAAARLRGAAVALEGDAAAISRGREVAALLGLLPVEVDAAGKAAYHAGASLVANGTVALVAIAEHLAREAGVAPERARGLYQALLRGAVENLGAMTPEEALTGPVRRGDAGTVTSHLRALSGEARELYLILARQALRLAVADGLDAARARAVAQALGEALDNGPAD